MTDLQAAMRDVLDAFERHPGHSPQSVHAGAKGKVKKLLDNKASDADWAKISAETELFGHPAKDDGQAQKSAWGADIVPEPPRKPPRPLSKAAKAKLNAPVTPEQKAKFDAAIAAGDPNWVEKLQAANVPKSAWGAPMLPQTPPRPVRPLTKAAKAKMAKMAAELKAKTPKEIEDDEEFKTELAALVEKSKAAGIPLSAWGGLSPEGQAKLGTPKRPRVADDPFYHRGYTDVDSARAGKPGDPISFLASTPGVKRDGLDLRAGGWRLDNYHKSPVFQWCHDKTMPPLGRVDAEAKSSLHAAVTFDQEDDFARKVESKYRRGFLHSVSVGWDFVDGHGTRLNTGRLSLDEIRDRAFYDLTEISGVPVPADPDALVQRTRAGLRSLGRELVALYDEQEDPDGEALAEEVRAALYDELSRMGIPIDLLRRFAAHTQQPANPAGFFVPETTAPAVPGIDASAARAVLAAFQLEGVK